MDKPIRPVFTLELNFKIVPGLVAVGKYDGIHPCLTAATAGDKVLIHSPHRKYATTPGRIVWSESNREISTLNVNQSITGLATGKLLPGEDKEILIIGTPTHLLAYHVHDNKDILYKECTDGVNAIAIGSFQEQENLLIYVGGNSTVHGYDYSGNEIFWTTVGDVVTSLIVLDFNRDGKNELIVSSEDYTIRVYNQSKIISECVETEVVTALVGLPENRFAYSVSNGTVGVYEQDVRLWRVKSKNFAVSIYHYDLLGEGEPQLITGWSNGKIDCRAIFTGEVLFKDSMPDSIAGIVEADYRSSGKTDLICVSTNGEVRGYTTTKCISNKPGVGTDQETVRDLLSQKQALLLELKLYENNVKFNDYATKEDYSDETMGVIPANTRLQVAITTNEDASKPGVEILLSTNNSTIIKAAIVFAEGIFKGETLVMHPPVTKLNTFLSIPIYPPKDVPIDLHIKAFVGYKNANQYHVFELTKQLPRFSMYALSEKKVAIPNSFVEFKIHERLQRISMWINQNFLLVKDIEYENGPLTVHLKHLRDETFLLMQFETTGVTKICTSNILLAGDVVQSLANFLNLNELESKASFIEEEEKLKTLLDTLSDIQDSRLRLGADVADRLSHIRNLVVLAEDSRINNIDDMINYYSELNTVNKELINGYNIRLKNYREGMETMKTINSIIQRASRLRLGQKSTNLINQCRTAIKNNNIEMLLKTIRSGE